RVFLVLYAFPTRRSSDLEELGDAIGEVVEEFFLVVPRVVRGANGRRKRYHRAHNDQFSRRVHAAPRDRRRVDAAAKRGSNRVLRSEEHTSELQSLAYLVC